MNMPQYSPFRCCGGAGLHLHRNPEFLCIEINVPADSSGGELAGLESKINDVQSPVNKCTRRFSMKIAEMLVYPIKSLRGSAVDEALVCRYGLEHDRRWMLVDGDSKMITQRECPKLATLCPHLVDDSLLIPLANNFLIMVPLCGDA